MASGLINLKVIEWYSTRFANRKLPITALQENADW